MRVMITGATGFVGHQLLTQTAKSGISSVAHSRRYFGCELAESVICSNLSSSTDWKNKLGDIDCIVHCAAFVHQMGDTSSLDYYSINVEATEHLALEAAVQGVKRFIFLSSAKVNGEFTLSEHPFRVDGVPQPQDPYAVSKYQAEQALWEIAEDTGLEVVVIRPPLIYGAGVGANFEKMIRWVKRGIPLPLSRVNNRRSFIYIDNLIDFILLCMQSQKAAGRVWLVSDGEDLSVPHLLKLIATELSTKAHLWPMPVWIIEKAARLFNKQHLVMRVIGNLQLDISETHTILAWHPPIDVETGIHRTVASFKGTIK